MQRIGFKEWAGVCQAILDGRQTVIIRKGGIAEGRAGFSFKHRAFYLFPTWFHEEAEKITDPQFSAFPTSSDTIAIQCAVDIEWAGAVTDWEEVKALAPFHIWREEVIRERFDYEQTPGVQVAFIRAFRLEPAWSFPNEKRFGGCRSWVELPETANFLNREPVLSDAENSAQLTSLKQITNGLGGRPDRGPVDLNA